MADSTPTAAMAPFDQQQQQQPQQQHISQQPLIGQHHPQPVAPMAGMAGTIIPPADSLAAAITASNTNTAVPQPSDMMDVDVKNPTIIAQHSAGQMVSMVGGVSAHTANVNIADDKDAKDADADEDAYMSYNEFSEDEGSEFEPDNESPKPKTKATPRSRKTNPPMSMATAMVPLPPGAPGGPGIPATDATTDPALMEPPNMTTTPKPGSGSPKTPASRTPLNRVRSGRVNKDGSPSIPSTLVCPVQGCEQKFSGRNPRQSLWHHLKYYATRGLPDKKEFEAAHDEAHKQMKRDAEPKGTPIERNRISSAEYRKKNPEKAKTSARLSNFRARARKKGITDEKEIEEMVSKWEKEWQEKQAKEASEYFSGILLSAFE